MTVLFGHPSGNPNSHHAALAHFETGRLEAFCVPWMPSEGVLRVLQHLGPLRPMVQRLRRRHFPPLIKAPKVQGRARELRRSSMRALGCGGEGLYYEANDWLMRTMTHECRRASVTAVHAYEDCSLWQFAEAKRLGKACIYDLPIGYYPAWEQTETDLVRKYVDWLPRYGLPSSHHVRPQQKREEMSLADLVLVPGTFVEGTVRAYHPEKIVAQAPYGVDVEFWNPPIEKPKPGPMRFLYAGQLSLRKGTPLLLHAWKRAALRDAELCLVGSWQLATTKRSEWPAGVTWLPPCSSEELRKRYQRSDVFVFPSFFEGFGLVILEAMACGLPVIATSASGAEDLIDQGCGRLIATGSLEGLVEAFRWFGDNRGKLPVMSPAARARAEQCRWDNYRRAVITAVAPFV
jgi:glycosyltransferase involved in cell wall biosynthesis